MAVLDAGRSVLVAAPTGAGKTLVADHAVARALAAGGKAFYTTPIKALSNQKHRDLAGQHGEDRVGLITGDRTHQPNAPVVVMTTEVLRSLLHERSHLLDGLAAVILDEVHFLGDRSRGPVWEEVVLHTPAHVPLVGLSATVPDADRVAAWMAAAHGPTDLVLETERPVPLAHTYAIGDANGAPPLLLPVLVDGAPNPAAELADGTRQRTEGVLRQRASTPTTPERRDLLEVIRRSGGLPAIWFVLSRAGCDRAAAELVDEGLRLTDHDEVRALRRLVDHALGHLPEADLRAIDHHRWLAGLEAGIAAHHGALLPVQRELVEAAFAEGLVKLVFATETLALGLNLPARTVVIDRVTRGGADGSQILSGAEFAQLAGRAGRRGFDRLGTVIVPRSQAVGFPQVAALAGGTPPPLRSWFHATPSMVLNLLREHDRAGVIEVVRRSYAERQRVEAAGTLRLELAARREELDALPVIDEVVAEAPVGPDPIAAALAALVPGDVVVDPGRPGSGRRVVAAPPRLRRGLVAVDVVAGDARRLVLLPKDLRQPPVVVGRIEMPEETQGARGEARAVAALLAELPEAAPAPLTAVADRGPSRQGDARRRQRLVGQVERLADELDGLEHAAADEVDAVVALLHRRGHLDAAGSATPSGIALRRLPHRSGPLAAEALARGLFEDLDVAETAALTSWFTAQRTEADDGGGVAPTRRLSERWQAVIALAASLHDDEADLHLDRTPSPTLRYGAAMHRWAAGAPLADALAGTGTGAGDLVREARQVVELLGQLAAAAPTEHVADRCKAAADAVLRGVVVAGVDGDQTWSI